MFSIIVGIAMLLIGIGFIVLTIYLSRRAAGAAVVETEERTAVAHRVQRRRSSQSSQSTSNSWR
jgi:hypothetical protein